MNYFYQTVIESFLQYLVEPAFSAVSCPGLGFDGSGGNACTGNGIGACRDGGGSSDIFDFFSSGTSSVNVSSCQATRQKIKNIN